MGAKKKKPQGQREDIPFLRELVPVMVDQLQLAHKVAHAARAGHMPRRSFVGEFEEAKQRGEVKPGKYLVPCDHPMNRAAIAVLDTGLNALCVFGVVRTSIELCAPRPLSPGRVSLASRGGGKTSPSEAVRDSL